MASTLCCFVLSKVWDKYGCGVLEFWAWLHFCGHSASLKFRQLESAVFDALGYFLPVCLIGVLYMCLVAFGGWGI